jgi:hypothetical protein
MSESDEVVRDLGQHSLLHNSDLKKITYNDVF